MKQNPLIPALALVAPGIAIEVTWTPDPSFRWDGHGPAPKREKPHDVKVTATAVVNGELKEGTNYLGGSYCVPGKPCPDVHGYFPQMAEEAIAELPEETPGRAAALVFLKAEMRKRWEAQQIRRK